MTVKQNVHYINADWSEVNGSKSKFHILPGNQRDRERIPGHMIQNAYAYHDNVTFTFYQVYHTELISGRNQLYVC